MHLAVSPSHCKCTCIHVDTLEGIFGERSGWFAVLATSPSFGKPLRALLKSVDLSAGALLGDKVASWLDPLVAMLLSVWLIYALGGQAYYNVMNLVGLSATPQFLQKLTYLCWNHDPRILQIDTVRWGDRSHCLQIACALSPAM